MSARATGSAVIGIATGAGVGLGCADVPLGPPEQAANTRVLASAAALATDRHLEDLTRKRWPSCRTGVLLV
jgi:hypothetical protein